MTLEENIKTIKNILLYILLIGILILSIKLLIHEKYEYQVISIDDYQFKEQMNNLGNSGWEAISARRVIDEY